MGRSVYVLNLGQGLMVGGSGVVDGLVPERAWVVEVGVAGAQVDGVDLACVTTFELMIAGERVGRVGVAVMELGGKQTAELEDVDVDLAAIVCAEVVLAAQTSAEEVALAGVVPVEMLIAKM